MNRLACCKPHGYVPGSSTIVHALSCEVSPEKPLTPAEYAEWRGHPSVSKGSHLRVVEAGGSGKSAATEGPGTSDRAASKRPPRRRPERWFTGITPELEDFS